MSTFQIILLVISAVFILVICECIRRRKLEEKYALLWLVSGLAIFAFSVFPDLLWIISEKLKVYYLTALFMICFLFLLSIAFSYAIFISKLTERNKNLSQELGILKTELDELRRKCDGKKEDRSRHT